MIERYIMKAILLDSFGGPEVLQIKNNFPEPTPSQTQVLIRIRAFGLNHAEGHMRRGEWMEAAPIIGIECVGEVEECPNGKFKPGEKVAALMGGLGRKINGSYAEYTCAKVTNTVSLGHAEGLPWSELAAIPETWATAWTALYRNLEIKRGQTLLIRGATSALGQAALALATYEGLKVIATTRQKSRLEALKSLGAHDAIIEHPSLGEEKNHEGGLLQGVDAVLNLVGNSVLLDSLKVVKRGGRACQAGWLGGLAPVPNFDPLTQMPSGVHFSLFASPVFGEPEFPLEDVPLDEIISRVTAKILRSQPVQVFSFDDIQKAHALMDSGEANGKIVVLVNQ